MPATQATDLNEPRPPTAWRAPPSGITVNLHQGGHFRNLALPPTSFRGSHRVDPRDMLPRFALPNKRVRPLTNGVP